LFVVEGDPGVIAEQGRVTYARGEAFFATGEALAALTVEGWTGRAADQFREAHDLEPHRWYQAGEGFRIAGTALQTYAGHVAAAQQTATWAAAEYARGDQVTTQARATHDAQVARTLAEATTAGGVTTIIAPFVDPGQPIRDHAVAEYDKAKNLLTQQANACANQIRAGCADAPKKPNWLESGLRFVGGIFVGAGEATWDLLTLAGPLSPINQLIDSYKVATGDLTIEELQTKYQLAAEDALTLVHTIYTGATTDPLGFGQELGKSLLDWDTWADDPARAIGHLVPDAIAAIATAGTAATATRLGTNTADALTDLRGLRRLDDLNGIGDPGHFGDLPTPPQGTHRGLYDPDLEAWIDEVVQRYPELDREGIRGLWDYTTDNGYDTMNRAMRGDGPVDPAVQARIDATSHGLDQLPAYEATTYRGTNLPQSVIDHLEADGNLTDKAFSSSSLDTRVAERFIDPDRPNPTRIIIEGYSGRDVGPFSAARGEAEILFRGGTKFEVTQNTIDPDGIRRLVVREVR
jgi:hypothetical protein